MSLESKNRIIAENLYKPRRLGKTELIVPAIGVGCAPLGNMGETFDGIHLDDKEASDLINEAMRSPIRYLDTSSNYGYSEERLGKAIKGLSGVLPEGCIVVTKADRESKSNSFSANQMKKSVEQSLKRLGLNSLPIVFLHDPEYGRSKKEVFEAIETLVELQKEGYFKHLGLAGGQIDIMLELLETKKFEVVLTHNRWNLVYQTAGPLIARAHELDVPVINGGIYGGGVLASSDVKRLTYRATTKGEKERVKKIRNICEQHSVPVGAVALQYSVKDPKIALTLVGLSAAWQINKTLEWAKVVIPEALFVELEKLAITNGDPEQDY